ncbi:neurosecretory protein VGF [Centroberyx affinis]|uniref:neurosecretory protein VGF n=1 Tax=Centroberyx affinis TaxID=166261 RepID=UPI003A5C1025
MIGYHDASSALTLLVLLTGASFLHLSNPSPIDTSRRGEEKGSIRKGEEEEEEKDEDELFKDVDPKTLAAVLLEALNKPQMERRREGDEGEGTEEEEKGEREEMKKEGEKGEEARTAEGANRDRDGRQELELVMAAQGREAREREEEEERKKAQEEEKLTEKVTSRTISQTVAVKTGQQSTSPNGRGEEVMGKEGRQDGAPERGPTALEDSQQQGEQRNDEEEEQLSPEELKNLETMMKEFPSFSTASKRERDPQQGQRESRGYSPYNDILPKNNGHDLAMSKKKLKWQEETQKAMNFPTFRGGNFMDEFDDTNFNNAGSNAPQPLPPPENDVMENDEPQEEEEEEEEEEEVLSPEEEEAQAKAEQEEVRRQAAEAQRAKMEEEKLADIASDMLLQYMVKQNNGNRKYRDQNRKYSSSLSNAAEDKRSDEEQEVMEEDDDIDPQTIDKLIEISSKLHLPADDVVDIISDVEKKKKKDVPPEMVSPWQRPLMPLSSPSSSSTNAISASQIPADRNSFQAPPAVNPLKAWFQEKPPTKSSLKPLSTNQDLWLKPQKSFWTSYPPYSPYQSYYQKKPYRSYYPIYFPPPPKPKPRYYVPKSALALNNLLGNSVDYDYNFPPKRRFRNWVQPRLRKPPASLQQNPYYPNYVLPSYPRTIPAGAISKPRSPSRLAVLPRHPNRFYYSPRAPIVTRDEDYYGTRLGNQADNRNNDDDLEKYIQQILMKRPRMFE